MAPEGLQFESLKEYIIILTDIPKRLIDTYFSNKSLFSLFFIMVSFEFSLIVIDEKVDNCDRLPRDYLLS